VLVLFMPSLRDSCFWATPIHRAAARGYVGPQICLAPIFMVYG